MHQFEEEYKKRFKDAQSNDGVDAGQLWEDIAGGLEQEPKRKRPWGILWLIVMLLIGGAVLLYVRSKPAIETKQASTIEEVGNSIAVDKSENGSDQSIFLETALAGNEKTENELSGNQPKETNSSEDGLSEPRTRSREASKNDYSNPTQKQEETILFSQDVTEEDKGPVSSSPESLDLTDPQMVSTQAETVSLTPTPAETNSRERTVVNPLPTCYSFLTIPQINLPNPVTESLPTVLPKRARNWQLATSVGVLSWTDRYAGQSEEASFPASLAATHSPRGGFELGMQLERKFRKGWSLATGLQYQQVYNTFEWTRQWDTVMYRNNVPGADLINAAGTRRVKQQNELRWLNVPLLAGYQSSGEKWQFGLQAGFGINYLLGQKGKTLLDQDTVLEFDQEQTTPYQQFFLGSQLSPYINYQLGEHSGLRFQGDFRYQWHGQSEVYRLGHQSLITGLKVAFLYQY